MKPGLNLEGPPSKAKYSSATDSEPVARAKMVKSTPVRGVKQSLKPHTYILWKPYAISSEMERVTAYLLHNGPASQFMRQG